MYAVIGATGNTGRATVQQLQALGEDPLSIVRDAAKARSVLGANARTALADIADRAALQKALQGIKRLFVVTGHSPQVGEQQIGILEAAKAAGVEVFVKVSGGRAVVGPDVESVGMRGHYAVEEALKKSGLAWVVLSPGLFMQNTFGQAASIKGEGKMVLAYAKDLPVALIDTRDIGALGARVLRDPARYTAKTLVFTGAVTTFEDFAKVFAAVLGRPVAYVGVTVEQSEQAMKARGMPDWLVAHLVAMARAGAKGAFSGESTQPIRDIVGRPPLTTRDFVEAHKAVFS